MLTLRKWSLGRQRFNFIQHNYLSESTCKLITPILKPNFSTNWWKTSKGMIKTESNPQLPLSS